MLISPDKLQGLTVFAGCDLPKNNFYGQIHYELM